MSEDDLNGIRGWLLVYIVISYATSAIRVTQLVLLFLSAKGHAHLTDRAVLVILLELLGLIINVAAATAILRKMSFAIPLVLFHLLCGAGALVLSAFISSFAHPFILLLRAIVLCAWFQYFRVSRRVRNTLGRNLFQDIEEAS